MIENCERAFAVYKEALGAFTQAESSCELQKSQVPVVEQHISAGADDRLSLDAVEIQVAALAQARLNALARVQGALGDLEDSVQRPLVPGDIFPVNSKSLR